MESIDTSAGRSGSVEVVHWWEPGDGEAAIEALVEEWRATGDHEVTLSRPENLRMAVKTRILQGDSPDVWFEAPGEGLTPYLHADVVADVTDVWERGDMEGAYLDGVRDVSRFDGRYRSVPLGIHRVNNLFYHTDLVAQAGVDPATIASPRELLDALDAVEAETGVTGLLQPMKRPWTTLQRWSTVLLGEHGPDVYRALADGRAREHRAAVVDALDVVAELAERAGEDPAFLDMTTANERFAGGESAFFFQGDWAAALYDERGMTYGEDWDAVAFPGTDGCYEMDIDACIVSSRGDDVERAKEFAAFVGSAPAQRVFTAEKGAIPPRTDVRMDEFDPFLRDQQTAFERSHAQPRSLSHGLAVSPEAFVQLKAIVSEFIGTWDVEGTADRIVAALDSEG
ncbi:MAG: ABC transporter substrate-binding protein [Haloarculaceae archaeon]